MNETYDFDWDDLGNLEVGRPNLGCWASLLAYRLMQYTFRDVLSKEVGLDKTLELFIQAGKLAGRNFCLQVLDKSLGFEPFIADLKQKLIDLKIGVLRVEEADLEALTFVITVSEDLDCSGLPIFGQTVCNYDEGFIAGIFFEYTGRDFHVKEIDCWATGDRTCRFNIKPA
ncbi:MAG: 4-vinyl reductase [Desulfuromonadaceae bacterium GWC2_58_13]|nr:MAG: 4-vinyl reductase [Desulfuromonadaceae bacterium GWC2_58_13]